MRKSELVAAFAARAGIKQREAARLLDTLFACVEDGLAQDERVSVGGFGTFEVKRRAAREVRVPSTGERVTIPASATPVFKPSRQLKEKLNA